MFRNLAFFGRFDGVVKYFIATVSSRGYFSTLGACVTSIKSSHCGMIYGSVWIGGLEVNFSPSEVVLCMDF